ncbi:N5-glutamine S-adenosyl-L-methionine-dependent methyltransferase [Agrococcus baldri]|uniref:N5-glutamine S-adenosyl-L-methionine-dependent methyltransferase n=1 Tax=Agrococcus baldri TaxID=153730 RepID=A0AA87RDK7_9MICO|nr:N5-glutamine S-adenosyl-L-methionine-dependent methyltransferase [Agrococcus baldri]
MPDGPVPDGPVPDGPVPDGPVHDDPVPGDPAPSHDRDALIVLLRAGGSVFAEDEYEVLREHAERVGPDGRGDAEEILELLVDRRVHGERIEHIVEHAQFAELRVQVDFGVFVPRSRTVLLASLVADRLRELRDERGAAAAPPRLLDFGCGTGAIAALAIHRVPGIEAVAVDSDRFAVACAERNLPGARVVLAGSALALATGEAGAAGQGRISASAPFDVIAANLPYVPTSQLQLLPHGILESEPRTALDGGHDGLDPLGEHALALGALLRDGGMLITEIAPHQAELGTEILELAGFRGIEVRSDEALDATVLLGWR